MKFNRHQSLKWIKVLLPEAQRFFKYKEQTNNSAEKFIEKTCNIEPTKEHRRVEYFEIASYAVFFIGLTISML